MRSWSAIGATAATALLVGGGALTLRDSSVRPVDEKTLREYAGVYRWGPNAFLYLQMWDEFSGFGKPQLVSFDESGEVRTLYPTGADKFFAGPGAAVEKPVESRVEFQRDGRGAIVSLTWRRDGTSSRVAHRVEIEKHEGVRFSNGDVQLSGTLITPTAGRTHPAIILVHGSGAENREYMLPWARFLIRHGVAVLGYDKRGVGRSTGDWNTASFDDLAGDAVAAFEYLKTRTDIDPGAIGLLGLSQAGWIIPLAAVRAKDIAFLISISGAAVPVAETTIDQMKNELRARGTPQPMIDEIMRLLTLQYRYARSGHGWDEYAAARASVTAKMGGTAPSTIPGTPDDPNWQFIRRTYFYDPGPTLRQLHLPVLAIFGELDNNIMVGKNKAAWKQALEAAGNRDYTLRVLPKANHAQLEAKIGSNAEEPSLQRFVPDYFRTLEDWLAGRLRGFEGSR